MVVKSAIFLFIFLLYIYYIVYAFPVRNQNSTFFQRLTFKPNVTVFFSKFPLRLGFNNEPTVSKFPLVIEFVVQKIQAQFSNYVYEDLSRPATWDKPVYTANTPLEEEVSTIANVPVTQNANEVDDHEDDNEDAVNELLFEKIPIVSPNATVMELQQSQQHFSVILIYVHEERNEKYINSSSSSQQVVENNF